MTLICTKHDTYGNPEDGCHYCILEQPLTPRPPKVVVVSTPHWPGSVLDKCLPHLPYEDRRFFVHPGPTVRDLIDSGYLTDYRTGPWNGEGQRTEPLPLPVAKAPKEPVDSPTTSVRLYFCGGARGRPMVVKGHDLVLRPGEWERLGMIKVNGFKIRRP